jgi:hypothetical protein
LRALVEGLLGDGLVADQLLAAPQIGFGVGEIGARLRQRTFALLERIGEGACIDGEQEIALLDDLSVLEMHVLQIAGDASAHLDRIDRDEAADIFVLVDDSPPDRLGDSHLWRRRGSRLLPIVAAAGHEKQRQGGEHAQAGQ